MASKEQNVPKHKRKLVQEGHIPWVAGEDLVFIMGSLWMLALKLVPASMRPRVIRRFCSLIGAIWHKANLRDARRVRQHLQILFPDRWSPQEIERHVRRQLTMTAWNALVLAMLPSLKPEHLAQILPIAGLDHLDKAVSRNQPVLMLGCHAGPYAYPIAAILQGRGYPVHEIGHGKRPRQGSSRLYRKIYWPRVTAACKHLNVVDPLEGPQRQLLDLLRRNEILYFLPDQYFILDPGEPHSPHLVQATLLGHTVNLETGGLRLGKRMGAQVLIVMPRQKDGTYHISIEPLALPTRGTTPADLTHDLQMYLNRVQAIICEQPFLWRDLRRADLLARLNISTGAAPL